MNFLLFVSITCITIGTSFQFGYQTGVLNVIQKDIENFIRNVTFDRYGESYSESRIQDMYSLITSMFLVGGMIGGALSGNLADYFGRKKCLFICAIPALIGELLMGLSRQIASFEAIAVGRLLVGMACGVYSCIGPLYLSELSPIHLKGAAGTIAQLGVTMSILFSELLGLRFVLGDAADWPIVLGFSGVFCAVHLVMLCFVPESPRWLTLIKKDHFNARKALIRLRGNANYDSELEEMQQEAISATTTKTLNLFQLMKRPYLLYGLLIALVLHVTQQLSGINSVIFYSTSIFRSANLHADTATYMSAVVALVNVLITVISIVLVERVGRRILFRAGCIVMLVMNVLLTLFLTLASKHETFSPDQIRGFNYAAIVCVFLDVCGFAIGIGSIPWFMVGEMFVQETRNAAIATCTAVNWACQIVIGMGYLKLQSSLHSFACLPFAGVLLLSTLYSFTLMPETKCSSPQQIEEEFRQTVRRRGVFSSCMQCFPHEFRTESVTTSNYGALHADDVTSSSSASTTAIRKPHASSKEGYQHQDEEEATPMLLNTSDNEESENEERKAVSNLAIHRNKNSNNNKDKDDDDVSFNS